MAGGPSAQGSWSGRCGPPPASLPWHRSPPYRPLSPRPHLLQTAGRGLDRLLVELGVDQFVALCELGDHRLLDLAGIDVAAELVGHAPGRIRVPIELERPIDRLQNADDLAGARGDDH